MHVDNTVLRKDLDMLEKPEASYQVCSDASNIPPTIFHSSSTGQLEAPQKHRHSFELFAPSIPQTCTFQRSLDFHSDSSTPNEFTQEFQNVAQDAVNKAAERLYRGNNASSASSFIQNSTNNNPVNNENFETNSKISGQVFSNCQNSRVHLIEDIPKGLLLKEFGDASINGVASHSLSRNNCWLGDDKALLKTDCKMEDSDIPSTKDIFIGSESPETTPSHKGYALKDRESSQHNHISTSGENGNPDKRMNDGFHEATHPIENFLQVKVGGSPNESGSEEEHREEETEHEDIKACCHCGENYLNETELTAHIMSEHGETCEECGQVFESAVKLVQHQLISHLQNDQTCQACGQTFDDSIKLAKHHILEHMGGVSCTKCGEAYPNKENFEKNTSICSRCSNAFKASIPQEYFAETRTDSLKEANRLHTCSDCGKGFTRITTLKLHKESVHEGVHRYTCQVCGKGFSRGYDLRRHSKFVHEGHQMLPIHKCNECEKRFGRMGDLRRHVAAVHQGLRPHVCNECEKGFTSAVYLKLHKESVHAGLRPHVCTDCGKAFSRTTTLRLHKEAIHEKLYRYSCDICGKGFTRSTDIRRHKKFVHEGHGAATVYACRECGKVYTHEYDRNRHEKYVHQGHVHVCVNCGDVFVSARILKKHIEAEHNGENDDSDEEDWKETSPSP